MIKRIAIIILLLLSGLAAYQSYLIVDQIEWLYGIIYLLFPLFAVISGGFLLSLLGGGANHSRGITLITIGFLSFLVAEAIWYGYELAGQDPFPSVADIFYLLAYPFYFAGVRSIIKSSPINWDKIMPSSLVFMMVTSAVLTATTIYYGVIEAYDPEGSLLENVIGISYGIADLVIIISVLLLYGVLREYKGGRLYRPWLYFILGMMVFLGADILFAIFTERYETEYWFYFQVDSLWMTGYALMAFCFFQLGFIIQDVRKKITGK